jgi:hypothetical protein
MKKRRHWKKEIILYYMAHHAESLMKTIKRPYSKSSLTLTLSERKFNLSFSRVSLLFLNSWGANVIPYYVTTHLPAIQKQH